MDQQQIKKIIDNHFTAYYTYYRKVCYRYYTANPSRFPTLWEDMVNEAYLKFLEVKPDHINRFHEINKLQNIGLLIIRSLFQKRKQAKKNGGSTSPLFEIPSVSYTVDVISPTYSTKTAELKEVMFTRMETAIQEALESDKWFDVTVLLQSQEEGINAISKKTNINRAYLTRAKEQAKDHIKKKIILVKQNSNN